MKLEINPLSLKSIQKAQKELDQYIHDLDAKNEEYINRLIEIAEKVIHEQVALAGYSVSGEIESGSDTTHNIKRQVTKSNHRVDARLTLEGPDILFIEFGSGVSLNTGVGDSPNPRGSEFGMTIGSYGKGMGKKEVWGYYDDDGELVLTRGTKATMPMYMAMEAIKNNRIKIAREVFGR